MQKLPPQVLIPGLDARRIYLSKIEDHRAKLKEVIERDIIEMITAYINGSVKHMPGLVFRSDVIYALEFIMEYFHEKGYSTEYDDEKCTFAVYWHTGDFKKNLHKLL